MIRTEVGPLALRELRGPRIVSLPPGPRSRALSKRLSEVECPAFDARREARADASGEEQSPIVYERAFADTVADVDGNHYVDLTAGFGSLIFGHAYPGLEAVLLEQLQKLPLALGDVFASAVKVRATEAVAALYPEAGARVLWGLSGSDAVTAAMKTMILKTKRARILAFDGGYHGLSMGPLAACGLAPSFREPFQEVLSKHVSFLPYPSEASLSAVLASVKNLLETRDFAGILVEPTQGRGGCLAPPPAFLEGLRALCTETASLLTCDEVWTGMGRSGSLLASASVLPDLVCLGKGLGGGYPVSACIGRSHVMEAWSERGGSTLHTATHFGAPMGCAAALFSIEEAKRLALPARAVRVGEQFRTKLESAGFTVTGSAMMIGIPLPNALASARALLKQGYLVLTGGAQGGCLTLSPALTFDEALLDSFVSALSASV
jgi:4-aminobutyrate aminotransferase / (S)-3-amino-2-methylpropionate transaminase / 5-aminovalerate transaminase